MSVGWSVVGTWFSWVLILLLAWGHIILFLVAFIGSCRNKTFLLLCTSTPRWDVLAHCGILLVILVSPGHWLLDRYIMGLKSTDILLAEECDWLVWDINKKNGMVTAELIYKHLSDLSLVQHPSTLLPKMWKGSLPIKIICFGWLCINHKILTWDGLQRRDLHGPGICVLCYHSLKTVYHIFGDCNYFHEVWILLCEYLSVTIHWDKGSLKENFMAWIAKTLLPLDYILAILWAVWNARI